MGDGAPRQILLGELRALPRPLAGFKVSPSKGRGGKGGLLFLRTYAHAYLHEFAFWTAQIGRTARLEYQKYMVRKTLEATNPA